MSMVQGFSSTDHWLLRQFQEAIGFPAVRFVLAERAEVSPPGNDALATVFIPNRRTLARMILYPEVGFGDGYVDGTIRVEGDLLGMLESVCRAWVASRPDGWYQNGWYQRLVCRWLQRLQANTPSGSRRNVHHHYDLGTDFYKLWLDSRMVYTCAYFADPQARHEHALEQAQVDKMELVCRKLRIQPGETVIEAGCGWGALALHMAREYGVSVRAFNISREQIAFARQQAKDQGLDHRVEFIEDDYRNIAGHCDAFVSVGMLEHVGEDHHQEFGKVIHRCLDSSGRGLLHYVGCNYRRPFSAWTRKHIFPGASAPTLAQVLQILEPWDSAVLDVENLRQHYTRTLEHWLERFERSAGQVEAMFDPRFVRTWRLYLAGSIASFRAGTLQLFQVVFARPGYRGIPWTREHLYQKDLRRQEEAWTPVMS